MPPSPRVAWSASVDKREDKVVWVDPQASSSPHESWLEKGSRFEGRIWPTFVRCVACKKQPDRSAGFYECDKATLARWEASTAFSYSPFQFKVEHLVTTSAGDRRPPTAAERERLLGFMPHHTITARKTSSRKKEVVTLERLRCSQLCVCVRRVVAGSLGLRPRVAR